MLSWDVSEEGEQEEGGIYVNYKCVDVDVLYISNLTNKNPAYGKHSISRRVHIVAPILKKTQKNLGPNLTIFLNLESIFLGLFL